MKIIQVSNIQETHGGAIRCDGTCGLDLVLKDGTTLELNGLSLKQDAAITKQIKSGKGSLSIDERLLISDDDIDFETFARRNGINLN